MSTIYLGLDVSRPLKMLGPWTDALCSIMLAEKEKEEASEEKAAGSQPPGETPAAGEGGEEGEAAPSSGGGEPRPATGVGKCCGMDKPHGKHINVTPG